MPKPDWRCGAARDLPITQAGTWDGPAAAKRMLDAAGIGGERPQPDVAKRGFLLYDAANPTLRGSYKLPFADKIDGKLTAHAAGIRAAASRLPQTDAPERERQRARQILDIYEQRLAKDGGDKETGAIGMPLTLRARPSTHMLTLAGRRLFDAPLALHPARAAADVSALFGLVAGDGRLLTAGPDRDDGAPAARPGYQVVAGVAVIDIDGVLVQRLGCATPFFGMTGYDGIRANIAAALADPGVGGIALNIDSPGGTVSGCFDLADWMFRLRGHKPTWAILSDSAFSAAYALASAADRIVVPESGGTGSIGIIALIADLSKALHGQGVAINVIQFGARKADGLEFLPLAAEARARFQADVNTMGERFVRLVARNRGIAAGAVRATQAGTFLGAAGVRAHLADAVAAPDAALAELVALVQRRGATPLPASRGRR